jgi:sugar porter (SP) family MFS transporter
MTKEKYNMVYLLSLALTSALGGLLFGYDWVVIGGAKPFYEIFFDINNSPSLQGWAMSSALVGCIFGAMLSGSVSDRYGRRLPLIWAALLFIISAYGSGVANEFSWFVIYRLIGGVGIGLASTLSPLYIAEVAPAGMRGRFVAINQLTIVIGILAAQIVNYLIADPVPEGMEGAALLNSWNGTTGWRWMFWAELIPAVAFFSLMLLVPKSPRFLVKIGDVDSAQKVLVKVGGASYAQSEIASIRSSFDAENVKAGFAELRSKKIKPILVLGIVLAVFQQWCGINVIFNYAEEVFRSAGYSVGDMLFNIIITGSVNLAFTLVAMKTVDHWGRRKLMLFGSGGLAVIYLILGFSYFMGWSGWPILVLVVSAIAVYAMSLAPVTWVVLSEIFPNRVRGLAMSIATLSLWTASFVLTFTFPLLNRVLGAFGTFWVYSFICVLGLIFIRKRLPETKGKSLEKIEHDFAKEGGQ